MINFAYSPNHGSSNQSWWLSSFPVGSWWKKENPLGHFGQEYLVWQWLFFRDRVSLGTVDGNTLANQKSKSQNTAEVFNSWNRHQPSIIHLTWFLGNSQLLLHWDVLKSRARSGVEWMVCPNAFQEISGSRELTGWHLGHLVGVFYTYFGDHPPKIWSTLLKANITPTSQSRHFWVDVFFRLSRLVGLWTRSLGSIVKTKLLVASHPKLNYRPTGYTPNVNNYRYT